MTLAEKQTRLALYIAAETAILSGQQSYTMQHSNSMWVVTRANLSEIRAAIAQLEAEIAVVTPGGGLRMRQGIPIDG